MMGSKMSSKMERLERELKYVSDRLELLIIRLFEEPSIGGTLEQYEARQRDTNLWQTPRWAERVDVRRLEEGINELGLEYVDETKTTVTKGWMPVKGETHEV